MLYIDAFNHILPKKYQAVLEQKVPNRDMSSNLSRYAETVPTLLDLDARFRLMDSVEGYMQVLTLAAPTVESVASPEVAVDLCRFANDEMAELVEKYPDRFAAAIAALPLNDLDASLKEIDRAIRDLRLRGIQMYSDVNGMPLDAEALYPIYEKDGTLQPAHPYPSQALARPRLTIRRGKLRYRVDEARLACGLLNGVMFRWSTAGSWNASPTSRSSPPLRRRHPLSCRAHGVERRLQRDAHEAQGHPLPPQAARILPPHVLRHR